MASEEWVEDLLGPAPEEDDEERNDLPRQSGEPDDEPAEEKPKLVETKDDEEPDETPEPDEATEAKAKPADSHDVKIEQGDPDAKEEAERERKRAEALQQELSRLRKQNRERELAEQRLTSAPPPTRESEKTTESKTPQGVPVLLSEDGQSVYVDQAALDQQIEARAQELIQKAQQPTPEQVRAREEAQAVQEFVNESPDNPRILSDIRAADEYMGEAFRAEVMSQGLQPRTMDDVMAIMRSAGIEATLNEHFPHVAQNLREFVESSYSGQPGWKRSVWRRIAAAANGGTHSSANGGQGVALQSVEGMPQALTRKGGGRTPPVSSDESEFQTLEREYRRDTWAFPTEKFKRYQELGRKLDKAGFD